MRAVLRAAGCDPTRDLGIDVAGRKTLDRTGHGSEVRLTG
jgi:hypothetical protein